MGLLAIVFTYIMAWWTVLFMVLPWGNRRPDTDEKGMAYGAPANPNMKKKMIATSLLSLIITVIIYYVVESEFISFREGAIAYEKSINIDSADNAADNGE